MFFAYFFCTRKRSRRKKTRQGFPLDPSAATALNAAAVGLVCLNETSDRQKSGGRIAEGKRTDYFGLRVMADGLFGLNSDYIEDLVRGERLVCSA